MASASVAGMLQNAEFSDPNLLNMAKSVFLQQSSSPSPFNNRGPRNIVYILNKDVKSVYKVDFLNNASK
jgi:hypothetical protein